MDICACSVTCYHAHTGCIYTKHRAAGIRIGLESRPTDGSAHLLARGRRECGLPTTLAVPDGNCPACPSVQRAVGGRAVGRAGKDRDTEMYQGIMPQFRFDISHHKVERWSRDGTSTVVTSYPVDDSALYVTSLGSAPRSLRLLGLFIGSV